MVSIICNIDILVRWDHALNRLSFYLFNIRLQKVSSTFVILIANALEFIFTIVVPFSNFIFWLLCTHLLASDVPRINSVIINVSIMQLRVSRATSNHPIVDSS